jgi:class 3 adenylate cyclase
VRRFLGVEPPAPEHDTILATVLFSDIVGSTEKQASLGDRRWKDLVEKHHAVVREALGRWRGVENDTAGDGFYATFDGPARAIRSALEVVQGVRELGIEVRAGLHTGECELIEGKCAGITVSIGARVAANAGPSQVLVSQTVKDLVAGSVSASRLRATTSSRASPTDGGFSGVCQDRGRAVALHVRSKRLRTTAACSKTEGSPCGAGCRCAPVARCDAETAYPLHTEAAP